MVSVGCDGAKVAGGSQMRVPRKGQYEMSLPRNDFTAIDDAFIVFDDPPPSRAINSSAILVTRKVSHVLRIVIKLSTTPIAIFIGTTKTLYLSIVLAIRNMLVLVTTTSMVIE
ncbi:hypothetical protein VNO78_23895 [Psophocarpus tetragonolobus]|uniref:Uncharacterized protein n=1 Tax=Psophocarpus tetragonolobus TaxID=3891 RepID=A0AAN9S4G0_PSOTE